MKFLIMPDGSAGGEDLLKDMGLTTDEEVQAAFPGAEVLTLSLREPTARMQQKIRREARVFDNGEWRIDEELLPQKRFANLVESWSRAGQPTEDAFLDLKPMALANVIDTALLAYCYPSIVTNPDFFAVWSKSRGGSEKASA